MTPKTYIHSTPNALSPVKDSSPIPLSVFVLISKKRSRQRKRKLASALSKPSEIVGMLVRLQGSGSSEPPSHLNV